MTHWPVVTSACADCGVGTITLGEWYMVNDAVCVGASVAWPPQVSAGRVPGQEILCIACLEARIGRTLTADDFTAVFPQR